MCYTLKNISSYLGSPIPTDNGNQTMHEYDALGNRVRTTYYTRKSLTAVPIGNILHPENNTSDYTITVDGFNENIVYTKVNPTTYNGTTWKPKFVHNPEGMMRHYSYEEHYPFYFIKDHLGNIRETYINPAPNTKYLIQRMQYYPSGIPWKTSTGANEHRTATAARNLCRCTDRMSMTAMRVGIIRLFVAPQPWIHCVRNITIFPLMLGVGIIL